MDETLTSDREPIPVLLYHRIAADAEDRFAVPPSLFREHLRVIAASGRAPATIRDVAERLRGATPAPAPQVALTIDDGFDDTLLAVEELVAQGLRVTVFVTTGMLDRPGLLSKAQLGALAAMNGPVELGAHTVSHPHLDAIPLEEARREVVESKRRLEDILGRDVDTFAYPHGSYDAAVRGAVIEAGYGSAAAVKNALSHPRDDPWAIARCTITRNTSAEQVAQILQGRGAPLAWAHDRARTRAARAARRMRRRIAELQA